MFNNVGKRGLVQPVFQNKRQPATDMNRKKVSEILRLKKRVFIEKPGELLPECFLVARERMGVRDSYMVLAKNWVPAAFLVLT